VNGLSNGPATVAGVCRRRIGSGLLRDCPAPHCSCLFSRVPPGDNACLAEDVSQKVFLALAHNARQLTDRAVLAGWLHTTARNVAANAIRSEVRRRAWEKEAAAMKELLATDTEPVWGSSHNISTTPSAGEEAAVRWVVSNFRRR